MTLDPSIDPKAFVLAESDVAAILNLPKGLVRANRGAPGVRWACGPHRSALWSLVGMEALREEIAAARGLAEPAQALPENVGELSRELVGQEPQKAAQPTPAPALPDGMQVLEIMGCRFLNRQVMHCVDPHTDLLLGGLYRNPLVCHVQDAWQFVPGMRILARRREGRQSNIFEYAGNPAHPEAGSVLPRQVGVW